MFDDYLKIFETQIFFEKTREKTEDLMHSISSPYLIFRTDESIIRSKLFVGLHEELSS